MRLSSADGCVTGRFARQRRTGVRTAGLGSNSSDQGFLSGRVKVACRRPVLCNVLRRYRRCETILGSAQDPLTHGVFRQPRPHFPTRRVRAHHASSNARLRSISRNPNPCWAGGDTGGPPRSCRPKDTGASRPSPWSMAPRSQWLGRFSTLRRAAKAAVREPRPRPPACLRTWHPHSSFPYSLVG